jgi:hypothetical protein
MRFFVLMALTASALASGCSNKDDAAADGAATSTELLAPPPAGQGVQYKVVSELEPGQEIERVQFFQVPPEGLYVTREEVRYTEGSHHVLIYTTPYTAIPTKNNRGDVIDPSKPIDAPSGGTADFDITGVIAGAQSANAPPIVAGLPEGVAVKLEPNTVLLMNTHYLNVKSEKVSVEARVNLWSIPKEQVKQEAGILFYYDPIIRVPAGQTASAGMTCPVASDITLVNAQTHMHKRGIGGRAAVIAPSDPTPVQFYQSADWENVPADETPMVVVYAAERFPSERV